MFSGLDFSMTRLIRLNAESYIAVMVLSDCRFKKIG